MSWDSDARELAEAQLDALGKMLARTQADRFEVRGHLHELRCPNPSVVEAAAHLRYDAQKYASQTPWEDLPQRSRDQWIAVIVTAHDALITVLSSLEQR